VVLLAVALAVDLRLRSRYRRRLRVLMGRIENVNIPPRPAPDDERDWVARVSDRMDEAAAEEATDTVGRVLAHVRDHLAEPLPVGEVAAAVGVSPRTLQRTCQDELGAAPRDVILAVKMRGAREALVSGRWQVQEVAEMVGFDSPYHFSRRFKDFYGHPPSDLIP